MAGPSLADQTGLSFTHLSYLTFQSVLQVVIISFAGFWCAYTGLLPKQGQKIVSLLNVDLFTPCLIFSKLAKSLSLAKILEISIIPLFYALTTGISFLSGRLLSYLFGFDVDETNFVVANSIFGNSNSLPVSLTLSLAYTLPDLTWDQIPDDSRDSVASRGILYLLIFQQIGQVLRWSWGYNKLMRWSENSIHYSSSTSSQLESQTPLGNNNVSNVSLQSGASTTPQQEINLRDSTYYAGTFTKIKQQTMFYITKIRGYMNPPLYSMLFSVIVASIHPLQHEFFHSDGFINNTLSQAIIELGSVSIPLILIVLGSNLYPSGETAALTKNHKKLVFASIMGRMVLPSCFILPIIAGCVKFIKVSILDDPIFLVVGFILTVSPPAIQLTQITQLNEFFEAEMANVLFWGYVVLTLPISIIIVSAAIMVLQWAQ
ncbi:unnamed protein product [Kluyveromyces dobzhanskii CBS 2104]|uniref:WGS project CCBQ000000000 data, contig 00104 n=1 Tax=Kluyveromyces dobzhanskii CBS 2104 TaxID=1427455 RepID=A0A0A8L3V1_9SACH|nr:unnamed protein product [Kluyveromyces dobzhanskii CBS 2104]